MSDLVDLQEWLFCSFPKINKNDTTGLVETKVDAARFLGVSLQTLYKWLREGSYSVQRVEAGKFSDCYYVVYKRERRSKAVKK